MTLRYIKIENCSIKFEPFDNNFTMLIILLDSGLKKKKQP